MSSKVLAYLSEPKWRRRILRMLFSLYHQKDEPVLAGSELRKQNIFQFIDRIVHDAPSKNELSAWEDLQKLRSITKDLESLNEASEPTGIFCDVLNELMIDLSAKLKFDYRLSRDYRSCHHSGCHYSGCHYSGCFVLLGGIHVITELFLVHHVTHKSGCLSDRCLKFRLNCITVIEQTLRTDFYSDREANHFLYSNESYISALMDLLPRYRRNFIFVEILCSHISAIVIHRDNPVLPNVPSNVKLDLLRCCIETALELGVMNNVDKLLTLLYELILTGNDQLKRFFYRFHGVRDWIASLLELDDAVKLQSIQRESSSGRNRAVRLIQPLTHSDETDLLRNYFSTETTICESFIALLNFNESYTHIDALEALFFCAQKLPEIRPRMVQLGINEALAELERVEQSKIDNQYSIYGKSKWMVFRLNRWLNLP